MIFFANKSTLLFLHISLLLLTLLPIGQTFPPVTLLSIQSPDGDTIDCIDVLTQPSFGDPLIGHHILEETPKGLPNVGKNENINWQIWHLNGTRCPEGSIPKRRVTPWNVTRGMFPKKHEYAIGSTNIPQKIFGTKVTMSIQRPEIKDASNEFSLGQIWLASGALNGSDLNTIETGWQVFPAQYLDNQPRFFIFWTSDGYKTASCYNLRCPGFVQTSRAIAIEGAISPTSDLIIQIWKDPILGSWWLSVGRNDGGFLEPVGYCPKKIFRTISRFANRVEWGGETLYILESPMIELFIFNTS